MRELKIRFVDKGDGTVYKPITLLELCQQIELPRRIVLESENGDFVDTDDFLDQLEKGELIAERYTSLKDKNGKEIYEGDIVEVCAMKMSGQIQYDEVYCAYRIVGIGEEALNIHLGNFEWHKLEILGNIHENPELLNRKEKE